MLERQKRNISLNGFISWLEVKIIEQDRICECTVFREKKRVFVVIEANRVVERLQRYDNMSMSVEAMVIQRHSPFDVSMSEFCGISGSDSSCGAALEVGLSAVSSSAGATEAGCVASSGLEVATLAPRFMTQGSFVLGFLKGRP